MADGGRVALNGTNMHFLCVFSNSCRTLQSEERISIQWVLFWNLSSHITRGLNLWVRNSDRLLGPPHCYRAHSGRMCLSNIQSTLQNMYWTDGLVIYKSQLRTLKSEKFWMKKRGEEQPPTGRAWPFLWHELSETCSSKGKSERRQKCRDLNFGSIRDDWGRRRHYWVTSTSVGPGFAGVSARWISRCW